MNRREFSLAAGGAAIAALSPRLCTSVLAQPAEMFSRDTVVGIAKSLAETDFQRPDAVPEPFAALGYDQYRDIHFRRKRAFWLDEQRGFALELLHAGFIYETPVEIHIVENGTAKPIGYDSEFFDFGPNLSVPPTTGAALFSGIRLSYPINTPDYIDEAAVFQGGSYFRSLGKGKSMACRPEVSRSIRANRRARSSRSSGRFGSNALRSKPRRQSSMRCWTAPA